MARNRFLEAEMYFRDPPIITYRSDLRDEIAVVKLKPNFRFPCLTEQKSLRWRAK